MLAHDERDVTALIRADSDDALRGRGERALHEALGRAPAEAERTRVRWVRGDIEAPQLGLSDPEWRRLAGEVDEIFHCAASTRFDLPLVDSERVNVRGLATLLVLAREARAAGGLRRLHHVSTAYVAGIQRGDLFAEALPEDRHSFRNSYERTKARAERLLTAQSEVPYTIYRPSIIVGHSRTGRTTGWNTIYFPMRLVAHGHAPVLPCAGRQLLDCVPVDFVAEAIRALARRSDTEGSAFHLTAGRDAIRVEDLLRATYDGIERRSGRGPAEDTRVIGRAAWAALSAHSFLTARGPARRAFRRFRAYVPYLRIESVFDNRRELELLAKEGVGWVSPDRFVPPVVDYALRHDFGRA